MIRAITKDGSARCVLTDSSNIVARAAQIHGDTLAVNVVLGSVLTAASMMGSFMGEKDDLLTLRFAGDGDTGVVLASADYMGNVRGYIQNCAAQVDIINGKPDIPTAIGKGVLHVLRDLVDKEPYVGICDIMHGDVASDITQYYQDSEQLPTACIIGVMPRKELDELSDRLPFVAGGALVQLLPFADDAVAIKLEENVNKLPSLTSLLGERSLEEIAELIFDGIEYEIFDEFDSMYKCACSRDKTDAALSALGDTELDKLIADEEETVLTCQFCDQVYRYTKDELKARKQKK